MNSTDTQPPVIEKRHRSWSAVIAASVLVFAGVFALSVVTCVVIFLFQPETYMATVRIKVEQERPTVVLVEQSPETRDLYFLLTQLEVIQSQKILHQVIERLHLQRIWGRENAPLSLDVGYSRLRSELVVRQYRDTNLIEIAVADRDGRLAAEIANTIAEVFAQERLEVQRKQIQRGLDKLREEVEEQGQRVEAAKLKGDENRELERERRLYEVIKMRVQQMAIQQEVSRVPVEIIDRAEASQVPVLPNIARGVVRGTLIGLPLGVIFSLLTAVMLRPKS